MSRIFISYKRADKEKVFPIIEEIKQETGVDCWIDYQGIESGDQFQNVIINAIDNSDIVIFMLSRNFIAPYKDEATGEVNHSRLTYPQKEVMYALNEGKRIVPISIDGTTVNDCKWLKFNCSGLDYIDWRDKDQQNKFMNNLLRWCGTKEDDLDERREANYQNNVSQLAPWYKCPKVKLYGMRGAIIVALMCVSALLYVLFSPARLYIDAPGLSSAAASQLPAEIAGLRDSSAKKLQYILEYELNMDSLQANSILALHQLKSKDYAFCINGNGFIQRIRAMLGRGDKCVHASISESDDDVSSATKIAVKAVEACSPVMAVLADYEYDGEMYLSKNRWYGNNYTPEERKALLSEYIAQEPSDAMYAHLVLANAYEYFSNDDPSNIVAACNHYEAFRLAVADGYNTDIIINKIKYLKEKQVNINMQAMSLPDKLISKGAIPADTKCRQLIIVNAQEEKRVGGRKIYKATLSTFEKHGDKWMEKYEPFKVNQAINGIADPGKKREGDNYIPAGYYALPLAFGYEKDVDTKMDFLVVNHNHVWVSNPKDENYNKMIEDTAGKYKRNGTAEELRRDDHLYKYVIVIDYNTNPIVPGHGSAIFLHVERLPDGPTNGCVAMPEDKMVSLLRWLDKGKNPHIYLSKEH